MPAWITCVNASIGRGEAPLADWTARLHANYGKPAEKIELWWPWKTPTPTGRLREAVASTMKNGNQQLVALNLWAGNMAAGQRGVLHHSPWPDGHLDTVCRIAEETGVRIFNAVIGRGGAHVLPQQLDRLGEAAEKIHRRLGGTVLIEPLSGMTDYPITSVAAGEEIIKQLPGTGLLFDMYHLAAQGHDVAALINDMTDNPEAVRPTHVQVADVPGRGEPGTGEAPLDHWVKLLKNTGYTGEIAAEWQGL